MINNEMNSLKFSYHGDNVKSSDSIHTKVCSCEKTLLWPYPHSPCYSLSFTEKVGMVLIFLNVLTP